MKKIQTNSMIHNLFKDKKYIIVMMFTIAIYVYMRNGITNVPVEDLDIPSGIGIHIVPKGEDSVEYHMPISVYNYGKDTKISTLIHTGVGDTIFGSEENRQLFSNKKLILGLERIVILSEDFSEYGINNVIHNLFRNPAINDTSLLTVCNGDPEEILSFHIPDYASSSDYITAMLESSTKYNFFSDNYKFRDLYIRVDSEGRNLVLPYVELKEDQLQITGIALFKRDKMVNKINLSEAKILNMLRENNVRGVLELKEDSNKYITYYAATKRKVRCEKKDDKYTFFIDISFNGDITENYLYENIGGSKESMEKFQKDMKAYVEALCNSFIEKMQTNYKVDCLELGKFAAAKYGRHKGIDWDKVISDADIRLSIDVKVDRMGRGDY